MRMHHQRATSRFRTPQTIAQCRCSRRCFTPGRAARIQNLKTPLTRRDQTLYESSGAELLALDTPRPRAVASEGYQYDVGNADHPWKEWASFEVDYKEVSELGKRDPRHNWLVVLQGAASPAVVRRLIGMGTWLLRGMLAPEFEFLVSEIEGLWRQLLETSPGRSTFTRISLFALGGFGLIPLSKTEKLVDSMDKDGEKGEGFSRESDNPRPTDPEYPRMFIENRMYFSDKFSKLHMGVGVRQDGLQFVHCAMIPKPDYNIPIFSVDIIGMKRISLAHVDLIPVTGAQTLPEIYAEGMRLLQTESIASNRPNPKWAADIASPFMVSFAPKDEKDSVRFLSYTALLSKVYMKTSEVMEPMKSLEQVAEIKSAHEKFLLQSREHEQFRIAMEKSFGEDWANEYLRQCFFPLK